MRAATMLAGLAVLGCSANVGSTPPGGEGEGAGSARSPVAPAPSESTSPPGRGDASLPVDMLRVPFDGNAARDAGGTSPDAGGQPDARPSDGSAPAALNPLLDKCGPGTPKLLPDGTLIALKPSTSPLVIGAGPDGRDPLPADLDHVRFYDRALGADDLARHAAKSYEPCAAGDGCVAEYTFDRVVDGAYPDATGQAPARLVGTVAATDGVLGAAARFDGSGRLQIAHDARFTFVHTFTFETWVRRPGVCPPTFAGACNMERVFEKGSGLRLDFHVGANWRFQTTPWVFHADRLADKNVWTHLAVTFDDARGVYYYRNGKLFKSCPVP